MAEVSLSDQYVLLLNDVIKENKAVREKLEQTSESSSEGSDTAEISYTRLRNQLKSNRKSRNHERN